MPVITLRRTLAAPLHRVLEVAKDVERYPEFMPDVRSVKVVDRQEDGRIQVVEWVGVIKQFAREVKWKQRDEWVTPTRVEFVQVEGDYDKMSGYWEFRDVAGSTEFENVLDYEYNIPLVGALIGKVVEMLVKQNLSSIMDGIEKQARQPA